MDTRGQGAVQCWLRSPGSGEPQQLTLWRAELQHLREVGAAAIWSKVWVKSEKTMFPGEGGQNTGLSAESHLLLCTKAPILWGKAQGCFWCQRGAAPLWVWTQLFCWAHALSSWQQGTVAIGMGKWRAQGVGSCSRLAGDWGTAVCVCEDSAMLAEAQGWRDAVASGPQSRMHSSSDSCFQMAQCSNSLGHRSGVQSELHLWSCVNCR